MIKKRIISYDIMKIIAAFAVVAFHSVPDLTMIQPDSFSFALGNLIQSLARIAVPVFIMITGALLLNEKREFTVKDGLKEAFNMLIIVTSWAVIYAIAIPLIDGTLKIGGAWLEMVVKGHYHLWYLYMLIGLYIVTPLLKKITTKENANLVLYYIVVFLIIKGVLPIIDFALTETTSAKNWIANYILLFKVEHFSMYITYYLLGWYITNIKLSKKIRTIIYVSGVVGFLITFGATQILSMVKSESADIFHTQSWINVILYGVAFFTFFVYKYENKETVKGEKAIGYIAPLTFGIYLTHAFFIHIICKFNLPDSVPATILMLSFSAVVLSFLASAIMSKIPVLKKIIRR